MIKTNCVLLIIPILCANNQFYSKLHANWTTTKKKRTPIDQLQDMQSRRGQRSYSEWFIVCVVNDEQSYMCKPVMWRLLQSQDEHWTKALAKCSFKKRGTRVCRCMLLWYAQSGYPLHFSSVAALDSMVQRVMIMSIFTILCYIPQLLRTQLRMYTCSNP